MVHGVDTQIRIPKSHHLYALRSALCSMPFPGSYKSAICNHTELFSVLCSLSSDFNMMRASTMLTPFS